jgi:hypothetical protein
MTAVIGIALFVAGYYHTRRAAEYTTVRPAEPRVVAQPALAPLSIKQSLLSFRVVRTL